jgi:hypothetical protein
VAGFPRRLQSAATQPRYAAAGSVKRKPQPAYPGTLSAFCAGQSACSRLGRCGGFVTLRAGCSRPSRLEQRPAVYRAQWRTTASPNNWRRAKWIPPATTPVGAPPKPPRANARVEPAILPRAITAARTIMILRSMTSLPSSSGSCARHAHINRSLRALHSTSGLLGNAAVLASQSFV